MATSIRTDDAGSSPAFDRWRVRETWSTLEALVRLAEGSEAAEAIHDYRASYYEDYGI